jgi:hypothetical protein
MTEVIAIVCTGRSKEELGNIAEQLVREKLVACANVLAPVSPSNGLLATVVLELSLESGCYLWRA